MLFFLLYVVFWQQNYISHKILTIFYHFVFCFHLLTMNRSSKIRTHKKIYTNIVVLN